MANINANQFLGNIATIHHNVVIFQTGLSLVSESIILEQWILNNNLYCGKKADYERT